jgi:hypothetical protein
MTTRGRTAPRLEEVGQARSVACAFCMRRLADEYYFTCRTCAASYCYIHMSRHQPLRCARNEGWPHRARAVAAAPRPAEAARAEGGSPVLLAGPSLGRGPSANV